MLVCMCEQSIALKSIIGWFYNIKQGVSNALLRIKIQFGIDVAHASNTMAPIHFEVPHE